ncbi:hypothetical protein MMC29_000719 [Sticta canariensis]|nr:hypothetical protein [Sticta canariensis]
MPRPTENGYPVIAWTANDKRLTHELLSILHKNDTLRRGVWPRRGENISGQNNPITKSDHRRNIARKLLKNESRIIDLLEDPKALCHYQRVIKYQLARLETTWKKAKETLGITIAGLPNEDSIYDRSYETQEKWDEVKQICPWFFKMRDMVEDGFADERTAITESETEVSLDPVESRDRRRPDRDCEMDDVREDYGVDDVEAEVFDNRQSSCSSNKTHTTVATSHAFSTSSQTALLFPAVENPSRQTSSLTSDLSEGLRQAQAAENKRKCFCSVEKEETKRLEIRERFATENRRLGLEEKRLEMEERVEMRRLALEEKKVAIRQRQLDMGQMGPA